MDDHAGPHAGRPQGSRKAPMIGAVAVRFVDRARRLIDVRELANIPAVQATERGMPRLDILEVGLAGDRQSRQSLARGDLRWIDVGKNLAIIRAHSPWRARSAARSSRASAACRADADLHFELVVVFAIFAHGVTSFMLTRASACGGDSA